LDMRVLGSGQAPTLVLVCFNLGLLGY
jgi:hypothetical protein